MILTEVRAHERFSTCVEKYSSFHDLGRSHMLAARQGLEPQFLVPETNVLPLDDRAVFAPYILPDYFSKASLAIRNYARNFERNFELTVIILN